MTTDATNPRSACTHCRTNDASTSPSSETPCSCIDRCSAEHCQGGFRVITCSVNGARYLAGRTTALPQDGRAPAGEGTTFATAADVRGHVRRELNTITSYWRAEAIDRDGVVIGSGVRSGFGGTSKRWTWNGALQN